MNADRWQNWGKLNSYENLMASLGLKLLLMHNSLSLSHTGDVLARLCGFCLNMCEAHNMALEFSLGPSQGELANLLGAHRISLARAVRELKQTETIEKLTKEEVIIKDLAKLREFACR